MVLVNGAEGIGTGWSCKLPNYNPEDIVNNLMRKMKGEEYEKMHPWYNGFKVCLMLRAACHFIRCRIFLVHVLTQCHST